MGIDHVFVRKSHTLLAAFVFFTLPSVSCAQTKQPAEGLPHGQPKLIWQYDTGG